MLPSPLAESGFAYGRSKASPDSEQIERNARKCKKRNSVSVEQIQDRVSEGQERGQNLMKISWIATSLTLLAMTLFTRPLTPAPHLGRGNDKVFSRFTSHFSHRNIVSTTSYLLSKTLIKCHPN